MTAYPRNGKSRTDNVCADLNAMHEAEKQVLHKNVRLYLNYGRQLIHDCEGNIDALFATARQRAEAFVLCLQNESTGNALNIEIQTPNEIP